MNKYEERKQAISRYEAGEKVTSIVAEIGKTRRWFYNWLERYQSHDGKGDWFMDRSRAPKTNPVTGKPSRRPVIKRFYLASANDREKYIRKLLQISLKKGFRASYESKLVDGVVHCNG